MAQGTGGARAGLLPPEQLDEYANLILLCKVHHKQVDDQPATYTVEKLRAMKAGHEQWVEHTLEVRVSASDKQNEPKLVRIDRIQGGKELLDLIGHCLAYQADVPEPRSEEEAEVLANLADQVQAWTDLYNNVDAGERVRAGFRLTSLIRDLESHGLTVWGGRYFG